MTSQQAFGTLIDTETGGRCAVGAILDAFGDNHFLRMMHVGYVKCPKCEKSGDLGRTIIHQNDAHHTPRHKIADWLEGLGL